MVVGTKAVDCSHTRHANLEHLSENLDAVSVRFTPSDFAELEDGLARLEIYGGRLDAKQMLQIGHD